MIGSNKQIFTPLNLEPIIWHDATIQGGWNDNQPSLGLGVPTYGSTFAFRETGGITNTTDNYRRVGDFDGSTNFSEVEELLFKTLY